GAPGIREGENRILSYTNLTGGAKLYVVAHRTGHLTDAYEVCLYKVELQTNVSMCILGYKDSYWWGCSIRPNGSDKLDIRALWSVAATYWVRDGSVLIPEAGEARSPLHLIDGIDFKWTIPREIL